MPLLLIVVEHSGSLLQQLPLVKDIQHVIHWCVPSIVKQYVQKTGRAGRDGLQVEVVLPRGKIGRHASEGIKC